MSRPENWVKLKCEGNRVFGFARDASGTLQVRCTAKECRRLDVDTIHQFNLITGLCVTEHVPLSRPLGATAGVRERNGYRIR